MQGTSNTIVIKKDFLTINFGHYVHDDGSVYNYTHQIAQMLLHKP